MHYAAVNPTDVGLRRAGAAAGLTAGPLWVAGMDAAGLVESAPGSDDLPPGTPVMAIVVPFGRRTGAQAEFVVVPRESVQPRADGARADDFSARVRAIRPDGVDALLDTALLGDAASRAVHDGGHIVAVRGWTGTQPRGPRVTEILVGHDARNGQAMADISSLAERGVLRPSVAAILDLADGTEAHRRLEAGGLRGRIVLRVAAETPLSP